LKWEPVFDDQIVASIGAIAVARSDANVVWAGTGDPNIRPNIEIGNGVYKSADAGKAWSHMGLDETGRIGRIAIDPRNPSIVFVAAWAIATVHSSSAACYARAMLGRRGSACFSSMKSPAQSTSRSIPSILATFSPPLGSSRFTLWFSEGGGPGSGIHVSRDGGTTWSRLTGRGLPNRPLGRSGIVISPSSPKRIYALIEN
jgi:hypothetical protein